MHVIPALSAREAATLPSDEFRRLFVVETLFRPGAAEFVYWETDRTIIGGLVPTTAPLTLPTDRRELAATHFLERREAGVVNLGPGRASVNAGGHTFTLDPLDGIYLGRGTTDVTFSSADATQPARLYVLSYPAHASHPTALIRRADLPSLSLGAQPTANQRQLTKYIHAGGVRSCQLVMGVTTLLPGSVWNTMPPHTHLRRSEVYCYFNLATGSCVFHFAGQPPYPRTVPIHEAQAVLSPQWSIHCGAGTGAYSFVWGMGGENQDFDDMDGVKLADLR